MLLRPETLKKYVKLALPILVGRAKRKKFITYSDLMNSMGGPGRGYIAEVLEEVSCTEHENERPLITALVVHKGDGLPGYGFWYIRILPNSIKNASIAAKIDFWKKEYRRVWDYWEKHDP